MSRRFTNSQMPFESPLGRLASLADAFRLARLTNIDFVSTFISRSCHRTGKWHQDSSAPLYRLPLALSQLWRAYRPHSIPTLISAGPRFFVESVQYQDSQSLRDGTLAS